ncbi:hypothetical protein ACFLSQ_03035 [Bacteroidota bacterium]
MGTRAKLVFGNKSETGVWEQELIRTLRQAQGDDTLTLRQAQGDNTSTIR